MKALAVHFSISESRTNYLALRLPWYLANNIVVGVSLLYSFYLFTFSKFALARQLYELCLFTF